MRLINARNYLAELAGRDNLDDYKISVLEDDICFLVAVEGEIHGILAKHRVALLNKYETLGVKL